MLRNFFDQPVNFFLSSVLILLFGLTMTSVVLDNDGLPNPLEKLGEGIALVILFGFYGEDVFQDSLVAST
jgi:hypothetical protein